MSQISREFNGGDNCTISAMASAHYHFVNWTENGSEITKLNPYTFTVDSNRTITGNFAIDTHLISASVSPSGSGTITGTGSYNYGDTCTLTAISNTGYNFTSWSVGGAEVSSQNPYTFSVSGNVSVVANFSLGSHTITATNSPSNAGTITGTGSYNYGDTCTLTAIPNTGYHFVNWDTGGGDFVSNDNPYSFTVSGDASFQALYAINSYTISASADPALGGSVSGTGSYNHGATVSLTATPNTGYAFVGWFDGQSRVYNSNPLTFTATQDVSLIAKFAPTYTVEVNYNNTQGTVSFIELQSEND